MVPSRYCGTDQKKFIRDVRRWTDEWLPEGFFSKQTHSTLNARKLRVKMFVIPITLAQLEHHPAASLLFRTDEIRIQLEILREFGRIKTEWIESEDIFLGCEYVIDAPDHIAGRCHIAKQKSFHAKLLGMLLIYLAPQMRNKYDRDMGSGCVFLKFRHKTETIHPRHNDAGHNDVRDVFIDHFQPVQPVLTLTHAEIHRPKRISIEAARIRIIVDNDNFGCSFHNNMSTVSLL